MLARIFDIKRDCSEDGPGIRTTVFFQGCPLHCIWCQNPEGRLRFPQELKQFHGGDKDIPTPQAISHSGYFIELEDLLYRVTIDKPFFDASGGGVTISGGEATQQMPFVQQFLQRLKQLGIHTAIETSGFFNYRRFQKMLLPYLDLIYFDVKIFDDTLHRRYTGQSNQLILSNLRQLSQEPGINLVPRIPLIPGITTQRENLQQIARLLRDLGLSKAVLLSYNPMWLDKLESLGMHCEYCRRGFMSNEEKQQCLDDFYSALKQPPVMERHTGTHGEKL